MARSRTRLRGAPPARADGARHRAALGARHGGARRRARRRRLRLAAETPTAGGELAALFALALGGAIAVRRAVLGALAEGSRRFRTGERTVGLLFDRVGARLFAMLAGAATRFTPLLACAAALGAVLVARGFRRL